MLQDALNRREINRVPCNADDPDHPACLHCGESGPFGRLTRYIDNAPHARPIDLGTFCDDRCLLDYHAD